MSALHERSLLIPDSLSRAAIAALAIERGGRLTGELPRTFSGAAITQWTLHNDPALAIELMEHHVFDVRTWRVRGELAVAAQVDEIAAGLPCVPRSEWRGWLDDADPLVVMRGLRAAGVLADPWEPSLEACFARALADPRAGMRWAAFRVLAIGRWNAAAALLRRAAESGVTPPAPELCVELAELLEGGPRRKRGEEEKPKEKAGKRKKRGKR